MLKTLALGAAALALGQAQGGKSHHNHGHVRTPLSGQ